MAHAAPSPAATLALTPAISLYLSTASAMPSSPSTGIACLGLYAAGVGSFCVGLHPIVQHVAAILAVAATRAGALAFACMALSISTVSAAAACTHVTARPSPTGRG
eukprot:scaffold16440_cov73-Phaeocystis_antarctica.AAC.1